MIKARRKTKELLYEITRRNEIYSELNSCFDKKAIDEKDEIIIFDWACEGLDKKELIYQLEKKKQEVFR